MELEPIEEFSLFLLAVWTLKTSYLLNNIQLRVWFKAKVDNVEMMNLSLICTFYRFVDKLFTVIIKREIIDIFSVSKPQVSFFYSGRRFLHSHESCVAKGRYSSTRFLEVWHVCSEGLCWSCIPDYKHKVNNFRRKLTQESKF